MGMKPSPTLQATVHHHKQHVTFSITKDLLANVVDLFSIRKFNGGNGGAETMLTFMLRKASS